MGLIELSTHKITQHMLITNLKKTSVPSVPLVISVPLVLSVLSVPLVLSVLSATLVLLVEP